MSQPQPDGGRFVNVLNAVKGLTFTNVLVVVFLAVVAVPIYVIYRALDNEKLLDRLMSTYEELSSQNTGCAVRHVQERGGPDLWGVSSGFAFQGADRWFVNVMLAHEPDAEEIHTYCESLKLIADRMLERGDQVHGGPVPGFETNGSGYYRPVPAAKEDAQ
jgi:hypothetical protein